MLSCSTAQLLDAVSQANPQLGTLVDLLSAPSQQQICPQATQSPRRAEAERMVKDAPSFGRIAAMVLFALSCFGLLLFLWLAFGGPVPLKPKGYRFQTSFAEAGQLALEADVRISGVPVGKVKTITPDKHTGRADVEIELRSRYRAAAVGRQGDPAPEDAARRDLRRADARARVAPKPVADGGRLAASQVSDTVELDEILRAFDPRTRAAFQDWMQAQAQAIAGHGRTSTTRSATSRRSPTTRRRSSTILNRQQGAVSRLIANTGSSSQALNERDGQLRSLIQNANTVFATTASRDDRAPAGVPGAADVRGRVAHDVRAADRVRPATPTRS